MRLALPPLHVTTDMSASRDLPVLLGHACVKEQTIKSSWQHGLSSCHRYLPPSLSHFGHLPLSTSQSRHVLPKLSAEWLRRGRLRGDYELLLQGRPARLDRLGTDWQHACSELLLVELSLASGDVDLDRASQDRLFDCLHKHRHHSRRHLYRHSDQHNPSWHCNGMTTPLHKSPTLLLTRPTEWHHCASRHQTRSHDGARGDHDKDNRKFGTSQRPL